MWTDWSVLLFFRTEWASYKFFSPKTDTQSGDHRQTYKSPPFDHWFSIIIVVIKMLRHGFSPRSYKCRMATPTTCNLFSISFFIVAWEKRFIYLLQKVLPLKSGHPQSTEAHQQKTIQEGPAYGECLTAKMHLWALADQHEHNFVFPGCSVAASAILKS